jgi:hypothetical protein
MRAEVWEPVDGITGPSGQVSFSYVPAHTATVRMTFAGLESGPPRVLTLKFSRVLILRGEEECPGGLLPTPEPLPILGRGNYPSYTFPLLRFVESELLQQYEAIFHKVDQPLAHFCLISLHNLVQVIASGTVGATWGPLADRDERCWVEGL